jgi:hypothetical protein
MKRLLVITCLAFAVAGCNNADKDKKESGLTKVEGVPIGEQKLPIPLEKPYRNWQIGSTDNVVTAMNGLKAFIDNDFTALANIIGDTMYVDFDNYQAKMSRDSALNWFKSGRTMYQELKINMYDYVSVISGDKSEEWVTFWYKQWWKNDKGVADSMNVVNDIKIKNGKMIELDEKVSRFQAK